jgi:alkylhydroperoxidase family enzyme
MARIDLPPGDGLEVARALMLAPHFADVVAGYEVDEAVHEQVADWRSSSEFSPVERAALSFTEQFCRDSAGIPDELIAELEELLPPGQLVELTLVVGKYVAMGRFMQVLGLDQSCDLSPTR